jgi:glycosyltransferase involved in cell wall biosynthesis
MASGNKAMDNPLAVGRPRKTILQLTSMWGTKYGGAERYFLEITSQCMARGYGTVLQYDKMPESPPYLHDLEGLGAQVRVVRLNTGRLVGAARALKLLLSLRPDVVHMHFVNLSTLLVVGLLAHRMGVRRVVRTIHAMPEIRSRRLTRVAYSHIDRILCVSRAIEAAMMSAGISQERLCTQYMGVSGGEPLAPDVRQNVRKELAIPFEASVITTIGFRAPVKGLDVAVDAFVDYLSASFPSSHLIVIGIRPHERTLVSGRADSVPGRIHWVGIHDDVRPYLAAADVYVQPSRSEGLALATLEAMAQSLPVVATNVGGTPELVQEGENGLLVSPNSPSELAAAVSRLFLDETLAARLSSAGHQTWLQKFDLAPSVDALIRAHYQLGS